MSPHRKAALVGIWVGGAASFFGFLPIAIATVFILLFGHSSGHTVHIAHPQLLVVPMIATFIAPIGLLFGMFGLVVLTASIVVYVMAVNDEHPLI